MKRASISIAACCVATLSFAQDTPERTPVAEFKDKGFSLEQVEEYRSNYNLPHLLTGGDGSVWFSQRTSEVMYTAHLPVKVPYMPLAESIMPEIGKVKAETKHFGTLTLNALTAANLLIVPVQCEYYAARAMRPILKLVELMRRKTNPDLSYRVLVTLYDRRNKICRIIRKQVEETFDTALFDTIIEIDTKLRESPTVGLPINLYAPQTRGAQQYRELAKELMNSAPEIST